MQTNITSINFISCVKFFSVRNQATSCLSQHRFPFSFSPQDSQVSINSALDRIYKFQASIYNSQICLEDSSKKRNIYLGTFPLNLISLPVTFLLSQERINLSFKPIILTQPSQFKKISQKKKIKQRTIQQAIQAVNKWLTLINQIQQNGKRIYTMKSAANIVGISRKTLKDYYNMLKLSEKYQFDFTKHHKAKMGLMKRFIRGKIAQSSLSFTIVQEPIDPDNFWALEKCNSTSS